MDADNKQLVQAIWEQLKKMDGRDRDVFFKAAQNLKSLTVEELADISARAAVAGCGGCDPCCAENEKGIDELP